MRIIAVIPARMGASRFPGKPLAPIMNMPMVEHVYKRTVMCEKLDAVYVATCDEEIRRAVDAFGGRVVMTSSAHERASDRVAEVLESIDADVVAMVQGDEPMVHPQMIRDALEPFFTETDVGCVNLVQAIDTREEFEDRNTIKVVMGKDGNALYFSRQPIPFHKKPVTEYVPVFKQVCIIPFRRESLFNFARLEPTPLEVAESIDMLRFLENGYQVKLVKSSHRTHAVDTKEDLRHVESLMGDDPLVPQYRHDTPGDPSR